MLGIVHQIARYCYVKEESYSLWPLSFTLVSSTKRLHDVLCSGISEKKAAMRRPSDKEEMRRKKILFCK